MKKLFYILIIGLLLQSCSKSALVSYPLQEVYPDTSATLFEFIDRLEESPSGWIFTWEGGNRLVYQGFLHFSDPDTLAIVGDFDLTQFAGFSTAYDFHSRTFKPSFGFALGNPFSNLLRSLGSLDLDFSLLAETESGLILSGNEFGNTLSLRPAQQEQYAAYMEGGFTEQSRTIRQLLDNFNYPYFNDEGEVEISFNLGTKNVELFAADLPTQSVASAESAFVFTERGIQLLEDINFRGKEYSSLSLINGQLQLEDSGAGGFIVQNSEFPIIPLSIHLGRKYTDLQLLGQFDENLPLPSWSSAFYNQYVLFAFYIKNFGFNLDLGTIHYNFSEDEVHFVVDIYQNNVQFIATFSYTLERDADGSIRFRNLQLTNGNAGAIAADYLAQGSIGNTLGTDSFRLHYSPSEQGLMAVFTSVENPAFYFSLLITN